MSNPSGDTTAAKATAARRPVLLVAEREIRQRLGTKSFRITTVIALLAVAAAIIVPHELSSKKKPTVVALVGQLPPTVAQSVTGAEASTGVKVRLVTIADEASADAQLRAGAIGVAVTADAVIVKRGFGAGDTSSQARLAGALATAVGLQRAIQANGIDPAAAQRALAAAPVPIKGLEARTPSRSAARTTALFGTILLYFFLSLYGNWILTGVVEEKTSRVVEVLLSTLRPRQLLAGKLIGIGAVALAQGVVIVLTALACAAGTGSNYLNGTNAIQLVETFGWFLLGFALYATLYGAAGSLVTRQEEAQNAAFPVTAPLLVAYFASFGILTSNHSNAFLTVLSYLPLTSPIAMPTRVAVGGAGPLDVAISVVITMAAIVVIANLAAKVYAGSILRSGKKVSWREALRARPS
jgi:ABC-2 type transport system permease protein